jgi:hypothetical protein
MKIQVLRLAIALAIGGPLAMTAAAKSSAAPINGVSIKAAAPAVSTEVAIEPPPPKNVDAKRQPAASSPHGTARRERRSIRTNLWEIGK